MKKLNMSIAPKVVCDSTVLHSDFHSTCRLCLNTNQPSLRDIMKKEIILLKRIADLQILEQDGLPKTICNTCTQTIDNIVNFISICKKNHQILTNIIIKKEASKGSHLAHSDFGLDFDDDIDIEYQNFNANIKHNQHNYENNSQIDSINTIFCQDCNLTFKTKSGLETHYKNKSTCEATDLNLKNQDFFHKECKNDDKLENTGVFAGQTPYRCYYCPKEFKFKSKLKQHIYQHQKKLGLVQEEAAYAEKRVKLKLKCNICDKVFSSRSGFQYHKLKHKGNKGIILQKSKILINKSSKTFLCNHCAKCFKIKSNLDAHLRIHSDEKPFKCNYCSKEFRQKSSLNRHSTSHLDINRKIFECTICEKSFTTKAHRDIHMRIHTGEKPYKCDFCQKCFNYRSQWQIHLRIHTGESPYVCSSCNNTYHDKGSLRKHQKKQGCQM